jgi:hypothetical protein
VKLALLALAAVLFAENASSAEPTPDDEKRACFRAVDEAQRLHIAHKLVEARDQFLVCARPVCPALFRSDCVRWLAEVEAALPSVVLGAKDAQGQDLIDVHVSMDGRRVTDRLEGTSIAVDPGPHVFRFEWEAHGAVERQAVIREGEKDRLVSASFPVAPLVPVPREAVTSRGASSIPAGAWILGGLGVAGGVGFAALYFSADTQVNNLRASGCAPNCNVTSARTTLTLGYVSLGLGVASMGVATTWFLISRSRRETTAISIESTPGGGKASLVIVY